MTWGYMGVRGGGVMGKKLMPCGTTAAYNRHKYRGEKPCADCRRAWNKYVAERKALKEARMLKLVVGKQTPPDNQSQAPTEDGNVVPIPVKPDPGPGSGETLTDWQQRKLLESVARLEIAMDNALPRELAGLVRQHTDIVGLLAKAEATDGNKGGVLDELARRRAERIAEATS